jgi:hypothetical protein
MRSFLVLLVAGVGVFAQPRPGPVFGTFGASLPPINPVATGPGHILAPPPQVAHPRHPRTAIVPVPVYYGGYSLDAPPPAYGLGYDQSQAYGQPAPMYGYNGGSSYGDASQSPVVIVNQNYPPSISNNYPPPDTAMRRYETPTHSYDQPAAPDAPPTIYLIAMKDHTIFPTLAYWVEGDTLNYVTTEGSHNRATLDLIDREFSRQLNDERHVEFKLPPAR